MCFIVALCAPWRRRLEALPGIEPLVYADNLKCSAVCPNALFGVAGFTARYVRSGRMCLEEGVLLSLHGGQEGHEALGCVGRTSLLLDGWAWKEVKSSANCMVLWSG